MQKRKLGTEGLEVSCIGLGCMGMSQSYGKPEERDEQESIKVIHRALELGVNFFDTAEVYGPYTNEELVGKALKGKRDQAIIATKFGWEITGERPYKPNSHPDKIKKVCDESLKRLGTDHIDLYYQHRVDPNVPIEEVVGVMSELVDQGKVRYIGLSEAGPDTIRRAHKVHKISALQSEYSLWERSLEDEVIPLLDELQIGLVCYCQVGRGLLTGQIQSFEDIPADDFRRNDPRYQGENFSKNLQLVEMVKKIAEKHHATPAQIAVAWTLHKSNNFVPIPGTKRLKYLEENSAAWKIHLPDQDMHELDGLINKKAGERYQPEQLALVRR